MLGHLTMFLATLIIFAAPAYAGTGVPKAGHIAPAFTYKLLNGQKLKPADLKGHPYVLWMVASWCSSCQTGSSVVGDHISELRARGIRVVEMRLANDLGAPGPGLQQFQKAVGMNAASPNWYWGELTQAQTIALDPKGYADVYYLIDAKGTIVAADGNPAASWDHIATFVSGVTAAPVHVGQEKKQ
ncbi:MAG: hypothetical protein NVSMB64_04200 [Candidatus Velthaea sp.]